MDTSLDYQEKPSIFVGESGRDRVILEEKKIIPDYQVSDNLDGHIFLR